MRQMSLLFLIIIGGCQTIQQGLFGEIDLPVQEVVEEKKTEEIKVSSLQGTPAGIPIFKLEEKGKQGDFRQALYYALEQSYSRTKQDHYRIVSLGNATQVSAVKNAMIEAGVQSDRIIIQSQDLEKIPAEIHVYER
ncbi:MAG: hypothetical protein JXR30_01000 [Alphaproteobacteria bacterium]|nr:hypothetical protein [Alphaproteobacteria bacterium]